MEDKQWSEGSQTRRKDSRNPDNIKRGAGGCVFYFSDLGGGLHIVAVDQEKLRKALSNSLVRERGGQGSTTLGRSDTPADLKRDGSANIGG